LSLKPSHFVEEDFNVHGDDETNSHESKSEALGTINDDLEMSEHDDGAEEDDVVQVHSDSDDNDVMQVDLSGGAQFYESSHSGSANLKTAVLAIPSLTLSGGFQWSGNEPQRDHEAGSAFSSDESDSETQPRKKKKRRKKEIEQDHTADMHTKTPESNADFERILLGSPNSSYLWIQYMSFQLQLSEVEKARETARRAIQTISFREEQ